MKELDVHLNDEVSAELKRDFPKYGFEVSEEFTEITEQYHEGKLRFNALRMEFQRAIIYLVVQIKFRNKKQRKLPSFLKT